MSTALATKPRTGQRFLSERVVRSIAETHLDTVPDEVVEHGKLLLFDVVAR
jgi:hypothetical protein